MHAETPKSDRDKVAALWPHSVRYGREVGTMMLIYIIALAYAATSPIILPFALIYFIFSWIFWRYNILYVSERCFESGGRIWDHIFKQICCCMFIFEFFTGKSKSVLLTSLHEDVKIGKGAFVSVARSMYAPYILTHLESI